MPQVYYSYTYIINQKSYIMSYQITSYHIYMYIYIEIQQLLYIHNTVCIYIHTHTKWSSVEVANAIRSSILSWIRIYTYIYTVLYTSCRHNSHHAAKGISCVAGAVKNTRQTCNSAYTWSNNPNSFAILGKKPARGKKSTMELGQPWKKRADALVKRQSCMI